MVLAIAVIAAGITVAVVSRDSSQAPIEVPVSTDASFRSRPDLTPPMMTVETRRPTATKGKLLLSPKRKGGQSGPAILDDRGRLQWFRTMRAGTVANDFRVQRYTGKPVLTWW